MTTAITVRSFPWSRLVPPTSPFVTTLLAPAPETTSVVGNISFTVSSFSEVTTMHTTRYVSLLLLLASGCATAGYSRSSREPAATGSRPDSMVVILAGAPSGGSAATTAVAARTKALADRRRRAELRGAKVFGREVLASADLVRAADLVRRIAGTEVTAIDPSKSWVTLRTCRVRDDGPTVFVDGTRVGDPIGVLNMFMATDLEMVEVYRGIAQLPPEVNEGCSAVFLWTRRSVEELAPAP